MPGLKSTRRFVRFIAMTAAAFAVLATETGAFGRVSDSEIRGAKPGTILRVEPLEGGAELGAKAYRILYRSSGLRNEPIAVTGALIFRDAPAPANGRNVVAWAHPTTGVATRCAPTLLPDLWATIPGIEEMLRHDYVVVATDYAGLGTPGPHPYLIGESEARAVLDSVRASRTLPDTGARDRFVVWGHSQGGHAALFTGELASSYAPELRLMGVAVAAPATYLSELFEANRGSIAGNSLAAMTLLSWSKVYHLPLSEIIEVRADRAFEKVGNDCIQSIPQMLKVERDEKSLQRIFLKNDPTEIRAWRTIMDANTPGQRPAGAPVFIAQGTADDLVRPPITRRFMEHLCGRGEKVRFFPMPGVSHSFAGQDSAFAAVNWINDRFRSHPAPNDC